MGRVRPLDLARQVGERHELLGPGRQVAQADLAGRQLVAEDDREMGAVARGRLELLAELAAAELGARRDPGRAELRDDPEPRDGVVGVGADDDRDRRRLGAAAATPVSVSARTSRSSPIPKPIAGRRPAAEQLDQPVVPPAAAERLLLALATDDVELERGPRVVVEAADEARLEPVRRRRARRDGPGRPRSARRRPGTAGR